MDFLKGGEGREGTGGGRTTMATCSRERVIEEEISASVGGAMWAVFSEMGRRVSVPLLVTQGCS